MQFVPEQVLVNPLPSTDIVVPSYFPTDLAQWLRSVVTLPTVVDTRASELWTEYDPPIGHEEKYRPENVKDEFWIITKPLMLHMNTTRIAVRSLCGAYSGRQERRITGSGPFADRLQQLISSEEWRNTAADNFRNAVLCGTSVAVPRYDEEANQYHMQLLHPVHTRVFTAPNDMHRVLAVTEHDSLGRWINFWGRTASGTIYNAGYQGERAETRWYSTPLPRVLASISYGEDRRSRGMVLGGSVVPSTPGYNRILTNAYYALGLLIKWQSRSILAISGGQTTSSDNAPVKFRQVAGHTALFMDQGSTASFLAPQAAFDQILAVVHSYLGFLAVALGLPKTVFIAQDNVSAQGAKLEGAPMLSSLRDLAKRFEAYECDASLCMGMFMHVGAGAAMRWPSLAELADMYRPAVSIEPWDYTDDPLSNATALVSLTNAGLMRIHDAVRRANPELTEAEVTEWVLERQREIARRFESEAAASEDEPPNTDEGGPNAA